MIKTTNRGSKTKAIIIMIIAFIIILSVTLLSYTEDKITNYIPTKVLEFPEIKVE